MDYKHKYNHLLELVEELVEAETAYMKYFNRLNFELKFKILVECPNEVSDRRFKAAQEIDRHLRINRNSLTIKLP